MMRTFLQTNLDSLKKLVLTTVSYDSISPSDCKTLSIEIFKKTGQQLSDTTLKRIYGFAYSKFQPSLFTLDAMARFCDFSGWADFCEKNTSSKPEVSKHDLCWETLKQNAVRTTGFTLQVLKNRSVIPYRFTVKRKFIDDHFDAFLKNGHVATIIAAPAGYGKTIALCHWVEEKMAAIVEGKSNDIVLFASSSALINVFSGEKDLSGWLLSLLGYGDQNDISALLNINKAFNGNFYLIIDGLDEHMFKDEQFRLLFNQVLDVFSFYRYHSNFKLVLTMRSATWTNYRHELIDENAWFEGFMTNEDQKINTPLFTTTEIEELCQRINPYARNMVGVDVAANFNHPLYFQYYYKTHKSDFSFNGVNNVSIYELISEFIFNKIFLGPLASEKTSIIRTLADLLDLENGIFDVDKSKVNDLLKQYHAAYNELLAIGFIRELNKSTDANCRIVIGFYSDKFMEYSIAFSMLFGNNNVFDERLVEQINLLKPNHRVQILKWCLLHAIKNNQHQGFCLIPQITLTVQEKLEVIVFIGEILDQLHARFGMTESIAQYFNKECSECLVNYIFGLEFICNGYIKTLQTLLRFELPSHKKLLIYTILASIAAMQLDTCRLENYLANIKAFPAEDLQQLPINPLNCLETIYYWLKYGILKKEALKELTAFYFNPPAHLQKNNTNDLLFLLALFTLSICRNSIKTRRFLCALGKVYENEQPLSDAYNFIIALMRAENHFRLNETAEGKAIFTELSAVYERNRKTFTPFIKTFFHLVKLEIALTEKDGHVRDVMKLLSFLADEAALKQFKLDALSLTLANCQSLMLDQHYTRQLHYEYVRIIRENGLREETFINNQALIRCRN